MHTLRPQHVSTAQTSPSGQLPLSSQEDNKLQGVLPLTQNPVPPVTEAQTQAPPGPQDPKLPHFWPAQELKEQVPFTQEPEGHCVFLGSAAVAWSQKGGVAASREGVDGMRFWFS